MSISLHHIRHATSILTFNQKRLLIDPMLSDVAKLASVPFTRNFRKNPLTPLPVELNSFENIDAILLTHRHFDHWDKKAIAVLNKDIPVFCQPRDALAVQSAGFIHVIAVEDSYEWQGIQIKRIQGSHAPGLTGKLLGPVSSFFLHTATEGSIFIVSDCIFTPIIAKAFRELMPEVAILNVAEAVMLWGTAITMQRDDIARIALLSPRTKLVVVHLETINHCKLSRAQLTHYLKEQQLDHAVSIPNDGETLLLY